MQLTGDPLTIFLAFLGMALSSMLAAISTSGKVRAALWATTIILVMAGIIGAQINISWIGPVALALAPPLIVGAVVLVTRESRRALTAQYSNALETALAELRASIPNDRPQQPEPVQPMTPEDRVRAKVDSRWSPDISMNDAVGYVLRNPFWQPEYGRRSVEAAVSDIHRGLYRGQLTGWARLHPDSEEIQISHREWNQADLERADGYALLRRVDMPIYSIRLSRGELESLWPPA